MIVVDSTVWIDFFNGVKSQQIATLRQLFGKTEILIGDLIICEVLQGFRSDLDARRVERAFARFDQASMVGPRIAAKAAANYRELRGLGITVRKTIDVLIATFCLEQDHVLLHNDRDFDPFVEHHGLKVL